MTKRVTEGARRERHSFPASRRSRARALPSLNLRLLAVMSLLDCMKFGIFGCPLWGVRTRQVSAIDSVRNKEVFISHRCNSVPAKRQVSVRCPSQRCVRSKEESTRGSSNREGWQRAHLLWDKQHETQKEETEIYKILKFTIYRTDIERDTAVQKLQNVLRNIWTSGRRCGVRKSIHFLVNF